MKKLIFLLAALLLLATTALAAPAAGPGLPVGEDPIVGKWVVVAMFSQGEEERLGLGGLVVFDITAKGSFAVRLERADGVVLRDLGEGAWERAGDAYALTEEDGDPTAATLLEDGEVLLLEDSGVQIRAVRYHLERGLAQELDPLVGEWRLLSYTESGEARDLEEARQYFEPFVAKGDGTFEMGEGQWRTRGVWSNVGGRYWLYAESKALEALLSEDRTCLSLDNNHGMVVQYEKRAA